MMAGRSPKNTAHQAATGVLARALPAPAKPRPTRGGRLGMPGPTRDAGPPPLIGVTTYFEAASWRMWVREAALLPASYVRAVERAGGVPVLLPPTTARGAEAAVRALDGIVLAGGGGLEPGLYGAERHHETGPPQPARDRYEFALIRAVIEADLPFL